MKIRESGMPDRDVWEKFFDLREILTRMGLDAKVCDVVEV